MAASKMNSAQLPKKKMLDWRKESSPAPDAAAAAAAITTPATPAAPQEADKGREASAEQAEALRQINDRLRPTTLDARFSVDRESGRSVIQLISRENGDVIRQFPSEEVLRISRAIDRLQGVMLDHSA